MTQVPLILPCLFPTTLYLVDDDLNFANSVKSVLPKEEYVYRCFDDPAQALTALEKNLAENWLDEVIGPIFLDHKTSHEGCKEIQMDIGQISSIIYNSKRFKIPSILITDQEMPGIKGMELCKKIKDFPMKKIMLR